MQSYPDLPALDSPSPCKRSAVSLPRPSKCWRVSRSRLGPRGGRRCGRPSLRCSRRLALPSSRSAKCPTKPVSQRTVRSSAPDARAESGRHPSPRRRSTVHSRSRRRVVQHHAVRDQVPPVILGDRERLARQARHSPSSKTSSLTGVDRVTNARIGDPEVSVVLGADAPAGSGSARLGGSTGGLPR